MGKNVRQAYLKAIRSRYRRARKKGQSIERLFLSGLEPNRHAIWAFLSAQDSVLLPELGVYGTTKILTTMGCIWPTPELAVFEQSR